MTLLRDRFRLIAASDRVTLASHDLHCARRPLEGQDGFYFRLGTDGREDRDGRFCAHPNDRDELQQHHLPLIRRGVLLGVLELCIQRLQIYWHYLALPDGGNCN